MNPFWLSAASLIALASPAQAQAQNQPQTMQQRFDAASKAVDAGECTKAIELFTALESTAAVQKNATAKAAVALRKGRCLIVTGQYQSGRKAVETGLAVLGDRPDFKGDAIAGYLALARAAYNQLDFDEAKRATAKARSLQGQKPSFDTLIWSARASMFDKNDDAVRYAAEALRIAEADKNFSKDSLAAVRTVYARALMNHGQFDDAYSQLKKALYAQGGLTTRVSLSDIVTRSDLATAAILDGDTQNARKYLAYTGAGRLRYSPFDGSSIMTAPACGGENGLKPEDSAIIQFGIGEDGQVRFVQPIYSSRNGKAAEIFAKEVSGWSWSADAVAKTPLLLRSAIRVELRCTNAISRPGLVSRFRDALDSWLAKQGVETPPETDTPPNVQELKAALAKREASSNPLAPVPILVTLSHHPLIENKDQMRFADRARALVDARTNDVMPRLYFDVAYRNEDDESNREYRKQMRALLADPQVAASPQASAAIRLLVAQAYYGAKAPEDQLQLLQSVANDTRLDDHDPLKVDALIRIAGLEAQEGNLNAARASYQKTGLTAQQCALVDAKPALRKTSAGARDFPREALQWGFSGVVKTEFDILPDGHTSAQRALIAYPPYIFDDAATGIVKRSEYEQSYRPEGNLGCGGETQVVRFSASR